LLRFPKNLIAIFPSSFEEEEEEVKLKLLDLFCTAISI